MSFAILHVFKFARCLFGELTQHNKSAVFMADGKAKSRKAQRTREKNGKYFT